MDTDNVKLEMELMKYANFATPIHTKGEDDRVVFAIPPL